MLRKNTNSGFTLLELLIALSLMAFVSFFTAQSMKTTLRNSKRIEKDIDIITEIGSAMNLLKADIRRAYNSRDLYIAIYNEAQREHIRQWQEDQKKPQGNQNNNPNPPNTDGSTTPAQQPKQQQNNQNQQAQLPPPEYRPRKERIVTEFVGEKSKIDLSSLNGNAIRKKTAASELVEIGYYVNKCNRRGKTDQATECLWRRLSYYLDGEVLEGGQESVLIEDVSMFELKYLRKINDTEIEWRDDWPRGNVETQNKLPQAVEVTLEIKKPTNKAADEFKTKRSVSYIPIDFENNRNVQEINEMNMKPNPLADQNQDPTGFNNGTPNSYNDDNFGSGGYDNGSGRGQ